MRDASFTSKTPDVPNCVIPGCSMNVIKFASFVHPKLHLWIRFSVPPQVTPFISPFPVSRMIIIIASLTDGWVSQSFFSRYQWSIKHLRWHTWQIRIQQILNILTVYSNFSLIFLFQLPPKNEDHVISFCESNKKHETLSSTVGQWFLTFRVTKTQIK
jgi:hypothetical protein